MITHAAKKWNGTFNCYIMSSSRLCGDYIYSQDIKAKYLQQANPMPISAGRCLISPTILFSVDEVTLC